MGKQNFRAEILPGTLDMLVLRTLTRGKFHGYPIALLIQQLSADVLRVEEGSLYPALQRLELNGWIEKANGGFRQTSVLRAATA